MVHIENLFKRYGERVLFEDVSWHVRKRDRIGLSGPNGAGKTTLLRMLAGLEEPDSGQIRMASDTTIGYLPQDGLVHHGRSVYDEVTRAFEELLALKAEQHQIEDELAQASDGGDHERLLIQEYDATRQCLTGTPRLIFKGTEFGGTEAPHLYRHEGYYHLMTAEGGTGYGHVVTMSRARRIEGPYELDPGNPILTSRNDPALPLQKAGHASLVQTQDGGLFLAYLCGRPLADTRHCNLGRETALQRCVWNEAGWLRIVGSRNTPVLEVDPPNLAPHPFAGEPARDEFDSQQVGKHFNTLREPPDEGWLSLRERPGFLRLRGRESPTSRFHQSLVARRLQAFRCEAITRVEFQPETFQQMAGLVCWYDEKNYIYLRISHDDQLGTNLAIMSSDRGTPATTWPVAVTPNAAYSLRVTFDHRDVQFAYSLNGEAWTSIGSAYDAGKLSDDYCGGFTGTFIGMAAHDLSGRMKHADFDFFEYREVTGGAGG